ncbi:hypothetical protein KFE25_013503 [Diacronema lutheri]|uniref:ANK_REP_REGION domain-containing protein n=1 Tax=Diacronema lutheri TaxID=2081491 RepID=A0A8J5XV00_DIALT|nr:hypothetical protein KFE25_013503 [Diacronema lutheri]
MQADIFRAASDGNALEVLRNIETAKRLGVSIVDCIDERGKTACVYAQLMGHADVVALLVSRGWTPMADGNMFKTSGGRLCYWNEPDFVRRGKRMPALMRSDVALAAINQPAEPARATAMTDKCAGAARRQRPRAPESKVRVAERRAARNLQRERASGAARRVAAKPSSAGACALAKSAKSRLPELDGSDLHELGLLKTRVVGGYKRAAHCDRLKTGAAAIVASSWTKNGASVDYGSIDYHDALDEPVWRDDDKGGAARGAAIVLEARASVPLLALSRSAAVGEAATEDAPDLGGRWTLLGGSSESEEDDDVQLATPPPPRAWGLVAAAARSVLRALGA